MSTSRPVRVESEVHALLRVADGVLCRYRRRIPPVVSDELRQEATLRTLQADGVLDRPAYVAQVARRLGLDWLRRRRELPLEDRADGFGDGRWQDAMERHLDTERVLAVLAAAPEPYRALIDALYFRHLDLEDLVREESADEADRARVRDLLYKRRRRAIQWLRQRLAAGSRRS